MIIESVIFLSYMLICVALFKRRFSVRATMLAFAAAAVVIAGAQAVLIMLAGDKLAYTLLPLTAYLPFSVLLYFLSECGIFETAAICSVGMLDVLILMSLKKILTFYLVGSDVKGIVPDVIILAIITAVAAGFVCISFRFIGEPFRFCVIKSKQNRLLLSIPIILIFLMTFYFLNSTTDVFVLTFTMLIAISVFLIIAKLLTSAAELIRVRQTEKEMSEYIEIQNRSYDRVTRKMEAGRVYRHDMRHHLTIIEGLARQGSCREIVEYTGKLNNSLNKTENISYCKSPELNAVLSEYISRAENAGCLVTHNIALPEKLPFEANDMCIVIANALDNAINACAKLPQEKRHINISAECTDDLRLFVSVKNPCVGKPEFDDGGLPITDKNPEEHGIGLRSVNSIAEKHNGFLRCRFENGEFLFQAALFGEEITAKKSKKERTGGAVKRAVSSLLALGAGTLIVLNVLPNAAEAASSLLELDILTVRSLNFGWGDSGVSMEYPVFEGNGAEEVNNAVNNCVDGARDKFMWYFNRRYNGYVAEDMRYTVIRDDSQYFVVQFNVTVNAGGSVDYSRWIVFDKDDGKVLELSDLFKEGSDYIRIISTYILDKMKSKNENEGGGFFVDGDDGFKEINEDVNFYIDSFNRLVIVFDEYEVTPGFMGCPEFIIPNAVIQEIAR